MKTLNLLAVLATALLSAAAAQTPDRIVTEATVNAPVSEVWRAWTTKEGIESWMVAKTQFELKVGGTWKTSYSKESNLDDGASIHQELLAFDPERMLAFRTTKSPDGVPFAAEIGKTWTVVYLEAQGVQTKVTVHMLGFTPEGASQSMRGFFVQGNRQTLDALVARFAR